MLTEKKKISHELINEKKKKSLMNSLVEKEKALKKYLNQVIQKYLILM